MVFEPVPAQPDFPALEAEVSELWRTERVFERSIGERNGPELVFYEGPPTANGRPGIHHVWARVYKDLFCRYWTMRGYRVPRRGGWDTHGLPVEVEVEKRLGVADKRAIEAYGVQAFVDACRASVTAYVEEWERLTERIGYWTDTAHAYWTMDPSYVESVWWHLKTLFDAGLLYEADKVVPYCPRCGTALSSHELGQPEVYREVEDLSAYVRLPIVPDPAGPPAPGGASALVVWTTTPWTLVANTGVAVHPDLDYVVVDGLVVAEERVEAVVGPDARARAGRPFPGRDLVGLRYRRPLEMVPASGDGWRVVPADFVEATEGSGLVHIAPAFGADDFALGRSEGLPTLNPVGPDGRYLPDVGWLAGREVRAANEPIVDALKASGLLLRAEPYRHAYPHCWRCRSPLLYWAKPSWYVATSSRKRDLLAANAEVRWRPEHIRDGRFGEWLENNVDWALSRDRYWGTPLPIWKCSAGHAHCVGSLRELGELAGRDLSDLDPHRPGIDAVVIACPSCGAEARRVEAVIDVWFDSGSMPAAQWGYPWTPGAVASFRFPAAFVCEAVDQTRGWFYSLLAVNLLVHGAAPYETVLCLGHIVDADGRKMSKSLGNVLDPWEALDTRGADPVRWWMFHQGSPWTPTRTSLEAIDASTAATLLTLWHTWSFFATYAGLNGFDPADPAVPAPAERPVLDRWLRSRVAGTVQVMTDALGDYQPYPAAAALGELIDDLSNWYVRRSRRRFWRTDPGADPADALSAEATLYEALTTIALLLAPFCPFLAEEIWRHLTGGTRDSVHLANWPAADPDGLDVPLETAMALTRRLASLGRAARSEAGVKVRQPLRRALVVLPSEPAVFFPDILAEELNVDRVEVADAASQVLTYELVPNFRRLGPRLGPLVQELRSALRDLGQDEIERAVRGLEAGETWSLAVSRAAGEPVVVEFNPDELEVRIRAREGFAVSREGREAVALDLAVDDDLRRRGLLREVLRQVQELRRKAGLAVADRIELVLVGLEELRDSADEIARETLASSVHFAGGGPDGRVSAGQTGGVELVELELDAHPAWVGLRPTTGVGTSRAVGGALGEVST